MTGAATTSLRANKVLAGTPCQACQGALNLGAEVTKCNQCGAVHHRACYAQRGGCATAECIHAPLKHLQVPPDPSRRRRGRRELNVPAETALTPTAVPERQCLRCGRMVSTLERTCRFCGEPTQAGPRENAPGAVNALVFGILSLVICGPIFGAVAISHANRAKAAIRENPNYAGEGYATAGMVLGIIGIVLTVVAICARVSDAGNPGF